MTQAFPLHWPKGRPKTDERVNSAFRIAPGKAFDEMKAEFDRFESVSNVVISSNIPLRQDGTPYRDGLHELFQDPGVAVFFTRGGQGHAICCDTFRRPWENCRAIGLGIEGLRRMERHGAEQILDQIFRGFAALPPPGASSEPSSAWWVVLGVSHDATEAEIKAAYKAKARAAGGTTRELNDARDAGLRAVA